MIYRPHFEAGTVACVNYAPKLCGKNLIMMYCE